MKTFNWLTRLALVGMLTGIGCLGQDMVSSDAGRFPLMKLRQEKVVLNAERGSTVSDKLFIDRYHYYSYAKLHADSVPPGITVTFLPATMPATSSFVAVNVAVSDAAASGEHRIVVRASGVVVRSATTLYIVKVP